MQSEFTAWSRFEVHFVEVYLRLAVEWSTGPATYESPNIGSVDVEVTLGVRRSKDGVA